MYYKQTHDYSCLLDATAQVCRSTPQKLINTLKNRWQKKVILGTKYQNFKYYPAVYSIRANNKIPYFKVASMDKVLFAENNCEMILGIDPKYEIPMLHAVYYDGKEVWDGAIQKSLGDIRNLNNIVYAIIAYDRDRHLLAKNTNRYLAEEIAFDWDNARKPTKKDILNRKLEYFQVV